MAGGYTIGALATAETVNVETIRYYQRLQMLEMSQSAGDGASV